MQHYEYTWHTADGLHLFGQSWAPDVPASTVLCLVHGLGEHSGCYAAMAQALTAAGIAVLAVDLRGHGYSGGTRGHAAAYDCLLNDLGCLLAAAETLFPGLPCCLYGHSMGGALVLHYVLRRQPSLRGVVAVGPALRTILPTPAWKLAAATVLYHTWPSFQFDNGIRRGMCTHRREEAPDPLRHTLVSARLGLDILRTGAWTLAHAAEFPLPLLIMDGADDRVTDLQADREFAARAPHATLKIWPGYFHELHNEIDPAPVFAYLIDWLRERVDGSDMQELA
jgi:acylglycerol lipase